MNQQLRAGILSRILLAIGAVTVVLAPAPTEAAGFVIFEQGGKAMGMAGAFTAQADDASAMFYNVGGVAFMDEREFYLGVSLISLGDSSFQGTAPFPGPAATGEQKSQIIVPPHAYWVQPINDKFKFGLAVNAPFGLVSEWEGGDDWPGRFLSEKAELINVDLTPSIAWRVSEKTGIALGVVARFAEVELRNRNAAIYPVTGQPVDVSANKLTSDVETGIGVTLGILHRANDRLSIGFQYKSAVEVDFAGKAEYTQILSGNAAFDAIVAASLPDSAVPITTSIEFPDQASLGVAYRFMDKWLAEFDLNWTGWSTFDELIVKFDSSSGIDDLDRPQRWDDAMNYRAGASYALNDRSSLRFGLYFDESPQPDETVSPLLPDADRWGTTFGYGYTGEKYDIDAYGMYVTFDDRTTSTNIDGFNGTYSTNVWVVGADIGF